MRFRPPLTLRPCPHREAMCGCDHPLGATTPDDDKRTLSTLALAFSGAMIEKLHAKADTGRAGWADDDWTIDDIKRALIEHVERGDPVDVANFAAFWWNRLGGDQ